MYHGQVKGHSCLCQRLVSLALMLRVSVESCVDTVAVHRVAGACLVSAVINLSIV